MQVPITTGVIPLQCMSSAPVTGPPTGPEGPELLLQLTPTKPANGIAISADHFVASRILMVETLIPTERIGAV